ncbi:MAG: DUF5615 family PIN-like protein [Planctomycetes bacterium]|nr:DUF5615 family PIN-like protein [Planctomycetota bacterium]
MRLKLDENLDVRLTAYFRDRGHDVETVFSEHLSGSADDRLLAECRSESRTLLTLDLDFANPRRFPPQLSSGIVVFRPNRTSLSAMRTLLESSWPAMEQQNLSGRLWIVESTRIRLFDPQE